MNVKVEPSKWGLFGSWQKLQSGWCEFGDSMMIYVSGAQKHVDVTSDVLFNEWPYSTTVAWSEHDGWCVLELCEKIFDLEELCKPIGQPYKNLLTIVTKNVFFQSINWEWF